MVRLFSAIELPDSVRAELVAALRATREADTALRWVPPVSWHVTLGFYGDQQDAARRGAWFRRRAGGLAPVRLRVRGAGRFPGVLWVGVVPVADRDEAALRALAAALSADDSADDERDFHPHVTVARWRRGGSGNRGAARAMRDLSGLQGSRWTATEVVLFRSDQGDGSGTDLSGGPVYTPLDRVTLASEQG
ncbi:RNA 2',3'-cyclic phosphodiesterase [Actinophytocola sp.]|uniref:RNA 2',3'-cyclic phosphodiesterase n=1 Tax=Actinophytocola sp. TaxID=1872138 RepID=UPI003D6C2EB6